MKIPQISIYVKTTFTSIFLMAALSASALEIEKRFTTPVVSYGSSISKSQKDSVSDLLKFMKDDLTFIEGGRAHLPNVREVQRFGGSATQTSRFIGLLKSAGLWEIQVRFRDFGEQESAFILFDHSSSDLKTVEVNSGRQDFLLKHFAEHLPQLQSTLETKAEQGGARQPATAVDSKSGGNEKPKPESEGRSQ
jgi:hypothetical protein